MSPRKRRSAKDDLVVAPHDVDMAARLANALSLLKRHLVHTREIPNGRDFLFLGPEDELRDALKLIVENEHQLHRLIHVDFARVDQYFLLRLVGREEDQPIIIIYFG